MSFPAPSSIVPSLTKLTTADAFRPIETPGLPARRRLVYIGDSNTAGLSAATDAPSGWRAILQRLLGYSGVAFDVVGVRGLGGLDGTGNTWGVFPSVDDFHDAWKQVIQYWQNEGHFGRRLSATGPVTSVVTGTDTINYSGGQIVSNGSLCALISDGTLPTITGLSPVTVNGISYLLFFAGGSTASSFQPCLLDSTTVADITAAGTGNMTLLAGLAEIILPCSASWGVAANTVTDWIAQGGSNDIFNLMDGGTSAADTLAALKTRAALLIANINTVAHANARRFWHAVAPIFAPASNAAAKEAVREDFNTWMRDTFVPTLGAHWAYIDSAENVTATCVISDGLHYNNRGAPKVGRKITSAIVASSGHAARIDERQPFVFTRRTPAPSILLSTTASHRCTFGSAATRNAEGSLPFWFAISFFPIATASGVNAIVQYFNPYTSGCLLNVTSGQFSLYYRKAGASVQVSSYTTVAQKLRWHRLFAFFDPTATPNVRCALFLNGNLIQEVHTTAAAVTSGGSWFLGGSSLNTAIGLYAGPFIIGVNSSYTIRDAPHLAYADYWWGETPGGTDEFLLNENTGTSLVSTVNGSASGTLTGPASPWVASGGLWMRPWETGYRQGPWDVSPIVQTAAYTAIQGELVRCDPTTAGFAVTLPTAIGATKRICVLNESTSTNAITINTTSSQTAGGFASGALSIAAAVGAAGSSLIFSPNGANWNLEARS
jgi:lysophospholipase L1-like esterase